VKLMGKRNVPDESPAAGDQRRIFQSRNRSPDPFDRLRHDRKFRLGFARDAMGHRDRFRSMPRLTGGGSRPPVFDLNYRTTTAARQDRMPRAMVAGRAAPIISANDSVRCVAGELHEGTLQARIARARDLVLRQDHSALMWLLKTPSAAIPEKLPPA